MFNMYQNQKSNKKFKKIEEISIIAERNPKKGDGYQYPIRIPLVNTTSKHY